MKSAKTMKILQNYVKRIEFNQHCKEFKKFNTKTKQASCELNT